MKKELKKIENEVVLQEIEKINADMRNGIQFIRRLRTCNACVLASGNYYLLKSYNTIIAAVDADGNLYDFLRYVYGYTATSAQHIAKFYNDYAQPIANSYNDYALHGVRYTYRPL